MAGWSDPVLRVVARPRQFFNGHFEATKQEIRLQAVEHAQRQRRELTDEVLTALGRLEARAQLIDERLDRIERAVVESQATADRAVAVVAAAIRRDLGTPDRGEPPA